MSATLPFLFHCCRPAIHNPKAWSELAGEVSPTGDSQESGYDLCPCHFAMPSNSQLRSTSLCREDRRASLLESETPIHRMSEHSRLHFVHPEATPAKPQGRGCGTADAMRRSTHDWGSYESFGIFMPSAITAFPGLDLNIRHTPRDPWGPGVVVEQGWNVVHFSTGEETWWGQRFRLRRWCRHWRWCSLDFLAPLFPSFHSYLKICCRNDGLRDQTERRSWTIL